MSNLPRLHRFAYWYASLGFRSPQRIWRLIRLVTKNIPSSVVILPSGFPLIVNERDWISKTIYEGTYERPLLHFLESLELQDTIVDIGANIGVTLWHSLKNSPSNTDFVAFEPSKQCLEGLVLTTSQVNQRGNIYEIAIGETNDTGKIFGVNNTAHSGGASLINHPGLKGDTAEIQIRTLDSVIHEINPKSIISLIKIDTEGSEAKVISGGSKVFSSKQAGIIIIEVSPNFGSVDYLEKVDELLGIDYVWFSLSEIGVFKRRPQLKIVTVKQSLEMSEQWNLVLVRNDVLHNYKSRRHKYFKAISF